MVEQSLRTGLHKSGSRFLLCNKCQEEQDVQSSDQYSCSDCLEKVKNIANSMKEIVEESSNGEQSAEFNQQMRSDAIDALLHSYEFALESKRSSLSAQKWLKSIGWATMESVGNVEFECNQALDGVALRARLRSAELTLSTKEGEIIRLNEELAKCRAEIGRLKSSSGAQVCLIFVYMKSYLLSLVT